MSEKREPLVMGETAARPAECFDSLEGTPVEAAGLPPWNKPFASESIFGYAIEQGYAMTVARRLAGFKSNSQGFRTAGSAANLRAACYLAGEMKRIGLSQVEIIEFPVYGWSYRKAGVIAGQLSFVAVPYVGTPSTEPEGLTAPLVYMGTGERKEYEDKSVRGKIALIGLDYHKMPWPSLAALQAEQFGAAAVIIFNCNSYGQGGGGTALTQQDWSNHPPGIPVVNVSPNCGKALVRASREVGPLAVTLVSLTEQNPAAHGFNVVGTIPGRSFPREIILLGAHFDGYFQGFQDDALGVGMALSIAKALVKSGYRPRRTIVLALVDAEEFGATGAWADWLIGSWNLINGRREWHGRVVAAVNLELTAYYRTTAMSARANDELISFLGSFSESFSPAPNAFSEKEVRLYRGVTSWTDEWSYSYFGIPTFGTKADPEMVENYYHTQYDTENLVCPRKADETVRFFGSLLLRLDGSLYHPYDFSIRAREFVSGLAVEKLAAEGVAAQQAACEALAFAEAAAAWREKVLAAERRYRELAGMRGNAAEIAALHRKARAVNRDQRKLARMIMEGTQFLGTDYPEAITPRSLHYQHDFLALRRLEKLVAEGRFKEAASLMADREEGVYGLSFAPYMTRELFRDHFILAFFNPVSQAAAYWTTGRGLYYHDLYDVLHRLKAGCLNPSDCKEILEELSRCRRIAKEKLKEALSADAALWRRARRILRGARHPC